MRRLKSSYIRDKSSEVQYDNVLLNNFKTNHSQKINK